MAKPLSIALPPDHILDTGCIVRLTALDPDTGAVVSGVNVQNVSMQVEQLAGGSLESGPFTLVNPVLVHKA